MIHRIELLGKLKTGVITLSGGEPLLHPELDAIISSIRKNATLAGLITNGYLLTADRIRKLNDAGLDYLQISIDNVMPDEVSKKSLKVLDKKLQLLSEHAEFHVNINSVLGGGISTPEDALIVGKRAMELGFTSTVGIIHDGDGQLRPLADREREVFLEMKKFEKKHFSRLNYFQENIAKGQPSDWRCRAGSRYLYICEDGLVHYCSQQRGFPAKPLGTVHGGRHQARIHHPEIVRADVHHLLRAPDFLFRFLPRRTDSFRRTHPRRTSRSHQDLTLMRTERGFNRVDLVRHAPVTLANAPHRLGCRLACKKTRYRPRPPRTIRPLFRRHEPPRMDRPRPRSRSPPLPHRHRR